MPKRPYEWRVDAHGCYKSNSADLALGSRDSSAHFSVFLHLRTTNLPGPDSITRSEQAQQTKDGLSAKSTDRSEGRGDVVDRDVVYQDHVSAHLSTSSAVASESIGGPTVSHGMNARTSCSSLCLVFVCVLHEYVHQHNVDF